MSTKIFINLPVQNLDASKAFYAHLGFTINPQMTDDTAACVVISDTIYVMLLTHEKARSFTPKEIADATKTTEVMMAISLDNRADVDTIVSRAVAAGGSSSEEPTDYGFMYSHDFQDLDGHIWAPLYMEPDAANPEPSN